jgi:hypothetical protein
LEYARPHKSGGAIELIDGKKFIRLPQQSDAPDVTPFDFDLFGMLKEKFKNCNERKFDELKQEVDSILRSIPEAELISLFRRGSEDYSKILTAVGSISKGLTFDLSRIESFACTIARMNTFRTSDIRQITSLQIAPNPK